MKFVSFIVLAMTSLLAKAQSFEHVEPAYWWVGMNHAQVEVMFHGSGIGEYTVATSEIPVSHVRKTENPNFLFLTLDTKGVAAGEYEIVFIAKKKKIKYEYILLERSSNSRLRHGFDGSDVIYLLMPDRFANGNRMNDSTSTTIEGVNREDKGARHGGDIQGIIDHLDYLNDLGVTAIWSTPLLLDNDTTYSYHTYGQGNVYQIDPRFGNNELYRTLAVEMHKREMKLIMDFVTNHWGTSHWMMKDMPTYNWFHQFPGYAQSNYRMTTQYDPNTSDLDKKYCEEGWFVPTMPDLDQSNELVLNYLIQNAIWWIEYAGLDGLRVDTYSYNHKEGIAEWTKAIMDEYPNFNIVGEVWLHDQAQISYWQKDSPIGAIQSYNSNLPAVMDFTLHDAITEVFNEEEDSWSNGMIKVYENFVNDFLYNDPNNLLVFLENHDTQRFNELYPEIEDYKLGLTLISTVRGIPQIYYGSEIGMKGDKSNGDGDIRRDFPGGWEEDESNAFDLKGRSPLQEEYHAFTKKLLSWRKNKDVIHNGKTIHFLPVKNVYVYFRYNDSDTVMIILNNSSHSQNIDLTRYQEMLNSHNGGNEILKNRALNFGSTLKVEAKESLIIELD